MSSTQHVPGELVPDQKGSVATAVQQGKRKVFGWDKHRRSTACTISASRLSSLGGDGIRIGRRCARTLARRRSGSGNRSRSRRITSAGSSTRCRFPRGDRDGRHCSSHWPQVVKNLISIVG
ncbi:hypothetical protein B0H13DRAFT_1900877 [Mycena leptocephala]|nr:hypothetical protein B0H13DRAFT_1900877 [Mycena leptocephala]